MSKSPSSAQTLNNGPPTMSGSSGDGSCYGGSIDMKEERPTHPHSSVPEAASQLICNPLRTMVSQNRRRYHDDGFNLDLTYITDRIIAMGYPADTKEAIYRNSMHSTVQFLEYNHKGHYKVFNLRGQYVYDTTKFHNRVLSFEMVDHHPPRLEIMAPFCREVHAYLSEDPRNVVAVHCKAGKGRTGVMICAYLCYISFYPLPRQNMDYYSIVRTHNNKGVTIPSQRRYVYYFAHMREKKLNYIPHRIELIGIYLERPPRQNSFPRKALEIRVVNGDVDVFHGDGLNVSKEIWDQEDIIWNKGISKGDDSYDTITGEGDCLSRRAYGWTVPSNQRVFLEGDIRIEIHSSFTNNSVKDLKHLKTKLGHCWLNSFFCCPSYCGGRYIHGDEAYPYPPGGTTISYSSPESQSDIDGRKKTNDSIPSSPPSTSKGGLSCSGGSMNKNKGSSSISYDRRKSSRTPRLSNAFKKLADGVSSSSRNNSDVSVNERDIKEGGSLSYPSTNIYNNLTLVPPPGLEEHCPETSLKQIYSPLNRKPPREDIERMLIHAHTNNLIYDSYNERRLSVPQEGSPIDKSPIGRPKASGPNCIMKEKDEHVTIFSVLEMDEACKNKELDPSFKMILVTRCLSPHSSSHKLAHKFLEVTREKQAKKDEKKRERVETRQRKLQQSYGSCKGDDNADDVCACNDSDNIDPRINNDPFLKRFLYRQRDDSMSRYPSHDYICPLLSNCPSTSNEDSSKEGLCRLASADGVEEGNNKWNTSTGSLSDDLDIEVRSYHPDEVKWPNTSCQSSTSLSSECEAVNIIDEG